MWLLTHQLISLLLYITTATAGSRLHVRLGRSVPGHGMRRSEHRTFGGPDSALGSAGSLEPALAVSLFEAPMSHGLDLLVSFELLFRRCIYST